MDMDIMEWEKQTEEFQTLLLNLWWQETDFENNRELAKLWAVSTYQESGTCMSNIRLVIIRHIVHNVSLICMNGGTLIIYTVTYLCTILLQFGIFTLLDMNSLFLPIIAYF